MDLVPFYQHLSNTLAYLYTQEFILPHAISTGGLIYLASPGSCTHHPAVFRTFTYHITPAVLVTFPYSHKVRCHGYYHFFIQYFSSKPVTWIHFAIRLNKKIGRTGFARLHTATSFLYNLKSHMKKHGQIFDVSHFQLHSISCSKFLQTSSLFVITLSSL